MVMSLFDLIVVVEKNIVLQSTEGNTEQLGTKKTLKKRLGTFISGRFQ